MLAEMIIDVTEHNKKTDFHGCTSVHTRTESANGDMLTTVESYADTSHEWWVKWADQGERIKVNLSHEEVRGVWVSLGGNFHADIEDSVNLKVIKHSFNLTKDGKALTNAEALENFDQVIGTYMVCDTIEQALEYWKGAVNNPDESFIIAAMPVIKEREPEHDGWRWHKWGNYIGTQNPQHEYIRDEEDINEVLCCHIYWVENK
jgi:hypothetical protein